MATLTAGLGFTGRLGNISAYTMKGLDKVILRSKGGASKSKINTAASFEPTRKINAEWKGVIEAEKAFNQSIYAVRHLADYNYVGDLNKLCKSIQGADCTGENGKRSVLFTKNGFLAEGFNLNKKNTLDTMLRYPLNSSINRDNLSAEVAVCALLPDVNFKNPGKQPLYRMVFSLGVLPDFNYTGGYKLYSPINDVACFTAVEQTEWLSDKAIRPAAIIELQLKPNTVFNFKLQEHTSLVLAVGIEFGIPGPDGVVQYVKYSGCGKVIKLG